MSTLIDGLRNPLCYPHRVERLHVVETHISWVVLTGRYAYKIKKPVRLGFLDFSTLKRRRLSCEEELRLNRRLASDLYMEVVAITGSAERPSVGGDSKVIEYAVKMRQFDESGLLDRVQARGGLLARHIDALAQTIGEFHRDCERALPETRYGSARSVLTPMRQNFRQVSALIPSPADRPAVERLRAWSESTGRALHATFAARKRDGYVRECHGDLHLGNAFLEHDTVRIFDCIEFNANLRWIDVMSEIAFMVMDLWHRDHPDLARRFLNAYLEVTGDYAGLATLPFYLVYRAMVRAKIALIRSAQSGLSDAERDSDLVEFRRFIRLAEYFSAGRSRWVALTFGASGSGKSFFTQRLLESCDAIRIRSDVERKRAYGLQRTDSSGSAPGAGIYTETATRRNYARIAVLATTTLDAGWPVIVDATCLVRWQRDLLRDAARRAEVPRFIISFQASRELLCSRVSGRSARGVDASEADLAVLDRQMQAIEPLAPDERAYTVEVDANEPPEPDRVLAALKDMPQNDSTRN